MPTVLQAKALQQKQIGQFQFQLQVQVQQYFPFEIDRPQMAQFTHNIVDSSLRAFRSKTAPYSFVLTV